MLQHVKSLRSQLISTTTDFHYQCFQLAQSILKSIDPSKQLSHLQSQVLMMPQQIDSSCLVAFQIDRCKHRSTIIFNFEIHRSIVLARYLVAVNAKYFLILVPEFH